MKTLIFTIALLLILSTTVTAQLEKGTWIGGVNGTFGFAGRTTSYRTLSWSFNPYAYYLISRNLAIGADIQNSFFTYKRTYTDASSSYSSREMSYSARLSPTVRKYFGKGALRPFVGLSTGLEYWYVKGNYSFDNSTYKESDFSYFLTPLAGFSWWMNEKVFLDVKASYGLIDSFYGNSNRNLNLNIGVGIKLGK